MVQRNLKGCPFILLSFLNLFCISRTKYKQVVFFSLTVSWWLVQIYRVYHLVEELIFTVEVVR